MQAKPDSWHREQNTQIKRLETAIIEQIKRLETAIIDYGTVLCNPCVTLKRCKTACEAVVCQESRLCNGENLK